MEALLLSAETRPRQLGFYFGDENRYPVIGYLRDKGDGELC